MEAEKTAPMDPWEKLAAKEDERAKTVERMAAMLRDRSPNFTKAGSLKSAGKILDVMESGQFGDILRPDNRHSRAVFEQLTGVKLPKTLSGTKALFTGKPFEMKPEKPLDITERETRLKKEEKVLSEPAQRSDVERAPGLDVGEPPAEGGTMFQNGQLKEYLDRKTGQAMLRISKLVKKGQSQQEARDLVREDLISPPTRDESAGEGISDTLPDVLKTTGEVEAEGLPRERNRNNRIAPEDTLFHSGKKARISANIRAIELLDRLKKRIESLPLQSKRYFSSSPDGARHSGRVQP